MTKEEKISAFLMGTFGGLCLVAYHRSPSETIGFFNDVSKLFGSIGKKSSKYSEAEDVEFEMVENPKEQTKEQLA